MKADRRRAAATGRPGGSITPMTIGALVLDPDTVVVPSVDGTGTTNDLGGSDGFTPAVVG